MPKKVSEEYEEIIHYTTAEGLAGIVSSGSLYATNARFLNDSEEIQHFFNTRLVRIAHQEASSFLSELVKAPETAKAVEEEGGFDSVIEKHVSELVGVLKDETMKFNSPYVFSASASKDKRERNNGVLSQWRGYGKDGGYAIVFDVNGLEKFLGDENEKFHYHYLGFGDVFYEGIASTEQPSSEEISEMELRLRKAIRLLMKDSEGTVEESFYEPITTLSCLYKHGGFSEEKEVRIIAIPPNEKSSLPDDLRLKESPHKTLKNVKAIKRAGLIVPYIELFSDSQNGQLLPITGVIIGPHPDAKTRKESVELYLKSNGYSLDSVQVIISDIPYVGR